MDMIDPFYPFTQEDIEEFQELADKHGYTDNVAGLSDEGINVLEVTAQMMLNKDFDAFTQLLEQAAGVIVACSDHDYFGSVIRRCLEAGAELDNPICLRELGISYYSGVYDDQDYKKAAEYYERASKLGDAQATVNLGYCYYYARHIDEPDYAKAYECFSRAVALDEHEEAYLKLGDMYRSGYFVEKSDELAFRMYAKAYQQGEPPMTAPAALRLGEYLLNGVEGAAGRVEIDPIEALSMFCQAEVGFYQLIDRGGLNYYESSLEAAIDGEQRARDIIAMGRTIVI